MGECKPLIDGEDERADTKRRRQETEDKEKYDEFGVLKKQYRPGLRRRPSPAGTWPFCPINQ